MRTIIDAELQKMDDEKLRREYRDWKPGQRKRPLVVSRRLEDFEEEASGATRWSLRDKRCGALAIKAALTFATKSSVSGGLKFHDLFVST